MGSAGPIALLTTDAIARHGGDPDMDHLVRAMDRAGLEAVTAIWHDDSVRWDEFDMIIVRSPWDYSYRLDDFLAWLSRVGDIRPLVNCPHVIRWNLDKSYLLGLAADGVDVIPTFTVTERSDIDSVLASVRSEVVVVKPLVSAGARDTGMFYRSDPAARHLASQIIDDGKRVAVQPAVPSVAEVGEKAVVVIDGRFSHAVAKGPILAMGGGLVSGSYRESIRPIDVDDAEIALAHSALRSIEARMRTWACSCAHPGPLYARFDMVSTDEGPLLLEAELFEPSLFFAHAPGSADRYASAVARRLRNGGSAQPT